LKGAFLAMQFLNWLWDCCRLVFILRAFFLPGSSTRGSTAQSTKSSSNTRSASLNDF